MTREEAKDVVFRGAGNLRIPRGLMEIDNMVFKRFRVLEFVDILYNDFEEQLIRYEQHIAELESPKTCEGCTHEKESSPLYIHCFCCNRMKTLSDKYYHINKPCKG